MPLSRPDIGRASPVCACARDDSSDRGGHSSWSTCHTYTDEQQLWVARRQPAVFPAGIPSAAAVAAPWDHRRAKQRSPLYCLSSQLSQQFRSRNGRASAKARRWAGRRRRRPRMREHVPPCSRTIEAAALTERCRANTCRAVFRLGTTTLLQSPAKRGRTRTSLGTCKWREARDL